MPYPSRVAKPKEQAMKRIDAYREIITSRTALQYRAEALRRYPIPMDLDDAFRRNLFAEEQALVDLASSPMSSLAEVAAAAEILAALIEEEVLEEYQAALGRRIATDLGRLARSAQPLQS